MIIIQADAVMLRAPGIRHQAEVLNINQEDTPEN